MMAHLWNILQKQEVNRNMGSFARHFKLPKALPARNSDFYHNII